MSSWGHAENENEILINSFTILRLNPGDHALHSSFTFTFTVRRHSPTQPNSSCGSID